VSLDARIDHLLYNIHTVDKTLDYKVMGFNIGVALVAICSDERRVFLFSFSLALKINDHKIKEIDYVLAKVIVKYRQPRFSSTTMYM